LAGSLLLAASDANANALRGHPSAYLALHADDLVDWRPLTEATLRDAQTTGRPLLISSGYFACHWCHVMQRESWRDPAIAAVLNRAFIPVKIDRELSPGIDAYLIDFAERHLGQSGWPLNVLVTPAGHPFYAVLYLPPDDLRTLLERTAALWSERAGVLETLAARAAREASPGNDPPLARAVDDPAALLQALRTRALELADPLSGGFGQQTRFPKAPQLAALLALQQQAPSSELAELLQLTLDRMAGQGLHDLLAGGFFRYTVDPGWQTPHFEKMLYTQALLAPVYLRAAEVLEQPGYRAIAAKTVDFMLSALRRPDGLFASSLSAVDAEGVEGGAYLWRADELALALTPAQRAAVALAWGLAGPPELAAGTLPRQRAAPADLARHGLEPAMVGAQLEAARARLMERRAQRSLPRDDKALVGWNGLALSALAAAAGAFDAPRYRQAGQQLRDALVDAAWRDGTLAAVCHASGCDGQGGLGDYAYLARGLRDWSKVASTPTDRAIAQAIARAGFERFVRNDRWHLSATALLPAMPGRTAFSDAPLPAPDAVLLDVLVADPDPFWRTRAREQLLRMTGVVSQSPFDHAGALWLLAGETAGLAEQGASRQGDGP
jgi:hypothetical protein